MRTKNYLLVLCILMSSVVFSQTGTTFTGSLVSGGVTRTYTYYVPLKYNLENKAVPVVFNLHGLSGASASHEIYMDFRTIADTANFIIVHPAGTNQSPISLVTLLGWGSMGSVASGDADRAFLITLLDTIEAKFKINTNKVYSAGYSQGGFMSYNLACLHSSRFTAVASSSGSLSLANKAACVPTHPIPVMEIHGTTDGTIPYAGSGTYLHTDSLISFWVKFNKCNPAYAVDTLPNISTTDNSRPTHYVYSGGNNGSSVELYKVMDGGHQVPSDVTTASYGLGTRNMDFKASKEVWRFFSQYSLDKLSAPVTATGVTEQEKESVVVSIYPNPSNGIFNLVLKDNANAIIRIMNVLGETVLEKNTNGNYSTIIDLSEKLAGVYFYQVVNSSGISTSGKLIVK